MTPLITATLTSRLTGDISDLAIFLPFDGASILGYSLAILILCIVFLLTQKFELWALTMVLIVVVSVGPFALTGFLPYWTIFAAMILFLTAILKFISHDLTAKGSWKP